MEVKKMACLGSIPREYSTPYKNRFAGYPRRGMIRGPLARVALCCLVASLAWTAVCAGQTGPGLGFRIGGQTFENPIDSAKRSYLRLEMEISSPLVLDDHLDVAFVIGGSSLGSTHDEDSTVDGNDVVRQFYDDDLFLLDTRVAARLYPFGGHQSVRPYVGGGIGYFWFFDDYEYKRVDRVEVPPASGLSNSVVTKDRGTKTVAHGFFPVALVGLAVAVSENTEVLFEFQYDIHKEDSGVDLSGPVYMLGGRYRF
jgi:hypothetical protein